MSCDDTFKRNSCPVCCSTDILPFIEFNQVPVHCNLLWPTRDQAINALKGDIHLGFCRACSHVCNLAFDPDLMEYAPSYENSLHFSPRFQDYVSSLAARLIADYDLRGKDIVEIGCGQGEFLNLICEMAGNRGVGFDPSYLPGPTNDRVTFVQDFYSERHAGYKADLICCRHVLEHIHVPRHFLLTVREAIADQRNTRVFFEVPNVLFMLRDLSIWDIIYEHCSYFSAGSLSFVFNSCDFAICRLNEEFGGQFLTIEALPSQSYVHAEERRWDGFERMERDVAAFADHYRDKVQTWTRVIEQFGQLRERAIVWGAGSKGTTFLNTLKTHDRIEYVVDINPRKQGMYVAGTGQQIVAPEFLCGYRPDVVIVMNPIYSDEIRRFTEQLGLTATFLYA